MAATTGLDVFRPGTDSSAKLAARMADDIIEDVMARGWPVGEVLGSESELVEHYKVSRAVFREAIRLVEHLGVAKPRRGPGGGLVVTEPTIDTVIDAVVLYLQRVDATLDEIFEARILLEEIACELASQAINEDDLDALRRIMASDEISPADARDLHTLVAAMSGNPGVALFVAVFNQVALLYTPAWKSIGPAVEHESVHAHAAIAKAIVDGNGGLAASRMRKHLEAEANFFRSRRSTRRLLPESVVLGTAAKGKAAEAVARALTRSIVAAGLAPGDLVGTEPELVERMGVSRAVLREAIRIMEYHHIARMRPGPGGGLFVVEPSASAVTETVAIYLARQGMQLGDLAELRIGVEVQLADLAARRIQSNGEANIRQALEWEATSANDGEVEAAHSFHASIANAACSRALELIALILIRLSRLHQIEKHSSLLKEQVVHEVRKAHAGIAAAVASGDREVARHRMRRHLNALRAAID